MARQSDFPETIRKQGAARVRASRNGTSGETIVAIAEDLGTSTNSLRNWAELYPNARLSKKRSKKRGRR
jgi:hypothetical protein